MYSTWTVWLASLCVAVKFHHASEAIPSNWKDLLTDDVYNYHANKLRGHNSLFESDIKKDDFRQDHEGRFKNAIVDRNQRWERGIVPYEVQSLSESESQIVEEALRDIMVKTCVRFVRHSNERDYIKIVKRGNGCSSYVGRTTGMQPIDLMTGCIYQIGEVQHEVMHALGFYHEQSRTDRDQYVTIVWSNIIDGAADQFSTYTTDNLNMPYDFDSIMHYGWNYFAKDASLPTILPKAEKAGGQRKALGNRKVMTSWDAEKINRLYDCPSTIIPVTKAPSATSKRDNQGTRPSWNSPTTRANPAVRPPSATRPPERNPHPEGTTLWKLFKNKVKNWIAENAHA